MSDYLHALTPGSVGMIFTIATSMVIAWILGSRMRFRMAWPLAVIASFVMAWCGYWLPVWRGRITFEGAGMTQAEYAGWAPVFIIPLFLVGMILALAVLYFVRLLRKRRGGGF